MRTTLTLLLAWSVTAVGQAAHNPPPVRTFTITHTPPPVRTFCACVSGGVCQCSPLGCDCASCPCPAGATCRPASGRPVGDGWQYDANRGVWWRWGGATPTQPLHQAVPYQPAQAYQPAPVFAPQPLMMGGFGGFGGGCPGGVCSGGS